jgi:glycosyltransferase involved in cell wall biosynthesis
MDASAQPRVVLVHDWLTGMRGGEKCLEVVCRRWPEAPLFTLLHKAGALSPAIERREIHTTPLQYLPGISYYYRYLLPLMPAAAASWRLPECDLVFSLSHCVAKSALAPDDVPHICYCFTPMRYAWHQRDAYFGRNRLAEAVLARLRRWDRATAANVSHFIAISKTVEQRIFECYGRSSTVIYPPVDTDFFCRGPEKREDFLLVVSAFAPYKRLEIAITACNRLRRQLILIGTGQQERYLRSLAGPTITFLGWQPDHVIRDHMRRCQAVLFPGEEDFGLVPVEAQACGAPVIAYGRGGATETVIPMHLPGRSEPTGIWFDKPEADCLVEVLGTLEAHLRELSPSAAREQALRFHSRRFEEELFSYLRKIMDADRVPLRQAA